MQLGDPNTATVPQPPRFYFRQADGSCLQAPHGSPLPLLQLLHATCGHSGSPSQQIKLICKGRLLEPQLSAQGNRVEADHIVHVLRSRPESEVEGEGREHSKMVYVTHGCRVHSVEYEDGMTVRVLRKRVEAEVRARVDGWALVYRQKVLESGRKLADYGIKNEDFLSIVEIASMQAGKQAGLVLNKRTRRGSSSDKPKVQSHEQTEEGAVKKMTQSEVGGGNMTVLNSSTLNVLEKSCSQVYEEETEEPEQQLGQSQIRIEEYPEPGPQETDFFMGEPNAESTFLSIFGEERNGSNILSVETALHKMLSNESSELVLCESYNYKEHSQEEAEREGSNQEQSGLTVSLVYSEGLENSQNYPGGCHS